MPLSFLGAKCPIRVFNAGFVQNGLGLFEGNRVWGLCLAAAIDDGG